MSEGLPDLSLCAQDDVILCVSELAALQTRLHRLAQGLNYFLFKQAGLFLIDERIGAAAGLRDFLNQVFATSIANSKTVDTSLI